MSLLVEAREGVRRQEAWGLTCALAQGQLSASQVALGEAQLKEQTEMQHRVAQLEVSVSCHLLPQLCCPRNGNLRCRR